VFAAMADQQVGALVIHEDTMLNANANSLAVFAAVRRLPSSGFPEFVRAGGLLAYGVNFSDTDYRAAAFVDKILKGAKAADLPIERSTKFNLTINLQTARALGLEIPPTLLAPRRRGDRVSYVPNSKLPTRLQYTVGAATERGSAPGAFRICEGFLRAHQAANPLSLSAGPCPACV